MRKLSFVFLLTLGLPLAAWAQADSQENKAKGKGSGSSKPSEAGKQTKPSEPAKPAKVYTNDDLDRYHPPEPAPADGKKRSGSTSGAAGQSTSNTDTDRPRTTNRDQSPDEAPKTTNRDLSPDDPAARAPQTPEQSQAEWRTRIADQRAAVTHAEADVASSEAEVGNLASRIRMSTDTNEILRLQAEQEQARNAQEGARQRIQQAKKALEDLLEEARRQGVPPGWLREP